VCRFVQYAPRCVSAAAVSLAARYLSDRHGNLLKLPKHNDGEWHDAFHVSDASVQDVSKQIMELYESKQINGPALANGSHVALMSQKRAEIERAATTTAADSPTGAAALAACGAPAPLEEKLPPDTQVGTGAACVAAPLVSSVPEVVGADDAEDEPKAKRPRECTAFAG